MKYHTPYFRVPLWDQPDAEVDISPFVIVSSHDMTPLATAMLSRTCRICNQPINPNDRVLWRYCAHEHHFWSDYQIQWQVTRPAPRPSMAARIWAAATRFFQRLWKRG